MKNWNKRMKICSNSQQLLVKVTVGYVVMVLIIGSIVYTGVHEWREAKAREIETGQIKKHKLSVHNLYMKMLELSFLCETYMEWDEKDFKAYQKQRQNLDSLLCELKTIYPGTHIDSVRNLWNDKELYMRQIKDLMHMQEETNRQIAVRIPVIARQSTQKPVAKKPGFLKRLFGKKQKPDVPDTSATTMLYALNKEVMAKQRVYAQQLSEQANNLADRNRQLNGQLQMMIRYMDNTVQKELRLREEKMAEAGMRSFATITGQTAFMLLLLGISYAIILRDMKRINRYKQKLEGTIGELEHTIGENEELIAARKRIMLTMTHDLRTPLAAISSYAELLKTEKKQAKRREYNQAIRQVTEHMVSMLNTLLGFFRLESGKEEVNPVPFRLHAITETLETDFMPLAAEKNLSLNVEESGGDLVVVGDKKRIIQIGQNLLSNAIKFTGQGTVTLRTRFENGTFLLTVEDTGTGISEEEQAYIFNAFERLPNAVTAEGGGLGLSLVKNLVELLEGKIELTSRKGQGSCFTVALPMASTDSVRKKGEDFSSAQPFTVLALDNDPVLLAAIKDMFARHGVMCTTCGSVRDMMERIRYQNYDLLITDLRMPQMNGFDVLSLLRMANVGNSRTIPVIAASAASNCDMEDLHEAGFSAYLNKPFSAEELMRISLGCLGDERQQEQVDFHSLLEYGDKREMLDILIKETSDDMKAVAESAENNDREALKEWTHHLSSSWEVIHAGTPLRKLFALLQRTQECSAEELGATVRDVLNKGKEIIWLAQQAKETYESNCC